MPSVLTVGALVDALQADLALRWVAGQGGLGRVLPPMQVEHSLLYGYFNLIRAQPVQLFGSVEADYFARLDSAGRSALADSLVNSGAACLVVVDNVPVPDEFAAMAAHAEFPLLTTSLRAQACFTALEIFFEEVRREHVTLHGVFMEVKGLGVLLSGAPGLGKSELALELVSRGHRLIADDAPDFVRVSSDVIIGRCPEVLQDFLEVRGLGVLDVRAMFGANAVKREEMLQLIIHLERAAEPRSYLPDRLSGQHRTRSVLGVDIPQVILPLLPGSNLAILVEGAVGNHLLNMSGYFASEHFIARQQAIINRGDI